MTDWQNLLTAALVGTGRQAPRLPAPGTSVGDALASLEGRPVEAALLGAAGALALYRRAGQCPAPAPQPLPEAAEAETQSVCRGGAARHLELMLAGTHREALPGWLQAAARSGVRVPERLLPNL